MLQQLSLVLYVQPSCYNVILQIVVEEYILCSFYRCVISEICFIYEMACHMTRKMRCWYKWDKRQIITRKMDIEKVSWRKIVGSQSESRSMQSISLTRGVEGFTKLGLEPPSSSEPRAIVKPGQLSEYCLKERPSVQGNRMY